MPQDTDRVEGEMLAEARDQVTHADQKASLILAALGIGLGALLGGMLSGDWNPTLLRGFGEVLWWVGAALAALAVLASAASVWPRYSRADLSQGIRYWGHVATYRSLAALSTALDENPSLERDRTRYQLWQLSRIADTKYRLVRIAMLAAGAAVVLLLVGAAVGR
jgi:hypothetical protein